MWGVGGVVVEIAAIMCEDAPTSVASCCSIAVLSLAEATTVHTHSQLYQTAEQAAYRLVDEQM